MMSSDRVYVHAARAAARLIPVLALLLAAVCSYDPVSEEENRGIIYVANCYTVLFPDPVDPLSRYSTIDIRWYSDCGDSDSVAILLCRDTTVLDTLFAATPNDGGEGWTTRGLECDDHYRLKLVSVRDTSVYDYSGLFEISCAYNGTIRVNHPEPGDVWHAGDTQYVGWLVDDFVGPYVWVALYDGDDELWRERPIASADLHYWWIVPASIVSGSRYAFRVGSYYDDRTNATTDTFTIVGLTRDSYEPDNRPGIASPIDVYPSMQLHALDRGDTDWVWFGVQPGLHYSVFTSSLRSVQTTVYADSGDSIVGWSYTSDNAQQNCIALAPAQRDTFFVRIINEPNSSSGPVSNACTLVVRERVSYEELWFDSPLTGSTWHACSSHAIRWPIDEKDFGTSVQLHLYVDTTYVLSIGNHVLNDGSFEWLVPCHLPLDSTYRIHLQSGTDASRVLVSPPFRIRSPAPDSLEPDEHRYEASPVSVTGEPLARTLHYGDIDCMRYPAQANQRFETTIDADIDIIYSFRSAIDGLLQTDTVRTATVQLESAVDDTHVVCIKPAMFDNMGTYTISVSQSTP